MMDFFAVVEARASVRKLEPVEIPEEHLAMVLDAGRRAPSGINIQPLQFIVVRDGAMLKKLAKVQEFVAQASALIAITADPSASKYWLEDASAAAENMLLAIAALGYASTWVEGTLLRQEAWAKEQLGVPEHLRLIIFLPMGKPAAPPVQAAKKPLKDLVHYERFTVSR